MILYELMKGVIKTSSFNFMFHGSHHCTTKIHMLQNNIEFASCYVSLGYNILPHGTLYSMQNDANYLPFL
jgi:hypothetical protein